MSQPLEHQVITHQAIPNFVDQYVNLAQLRLGAKIVSCSDDFFADATRLLNPEPAVFIEGKFDDNGKWMDGWETRRRRNGGYDNIIVKLGLAGVIKGVDIDTSHFTGNYPPAASLQACFSDGPANDKSAWVSLISSVSLKGDTHHYFEVDSQQCFNHIRLNIYPDGGIARLRIHGLVANNFASLDDAKLHNFAAVELGARAIACNDAHYGAVENLLNPDSGFNMGDGWETRRRREPGNDWCLIRLGHACEPEEIIIDTAHFKGNFPDSCSVHAAMVDYGDSDLDIKDSIIAQSQFWQELLPQQKLAMDQLHSFTEQLKKIGPINTIRLNIFPDGGLSRIRLIGKVSRN